MTFLSTLIGSKLAVAALAAGVLTVGSVGAAAYAGVLPTELQTVANEVIGAPAPEDDLTETEPAEDDSALEGDVDGLELDGDDEGTEEAKAGAPFGLCNAFAHGGLSSNSTAFESLAGATPTIDVVEEVTVDGVTTEVTTSNVMTVEEYCATAVHPGKSGKFSDESSEEGEDSDETVTDDDDTDDTDDDTEKAASTKGEHGKSGERGKSGSSKHGRP